MIFDLSDEDIGKKVIHGIENDDIPKQYGTIVSFDSEFVYCQFGASTKKVQCKAEDLDWDFQDNDFETGMEQSWEEFQSRSRKIET